MVEVSGRFEWLIVSAKAQKIKFNSDSYSDSDGEGSNYDRVNQYHFMDYYVLLHGEKVRPQERTYFSKAVKGFMVLNGPTHYIDKYSGGDIGDSFIGRVLIGDRVLTEKQLVEMAQRYVEENSWNKYCGQRGKDLIDHLNCLKC